MAKVNYYIGTAGWTVPKQHQDLVPVNEPNVNASNSNSTSVKEGSHLQRYSRLFNAVEINSSFYRNHQAKTYLRWAETVPKDFRFSVKLWKRFTHEQKLEINKAELADTLAGMSGLQEKFGTLLVQLPPSLTYDEKTAKKFFEVLKKYCKVPVVLEPRHKSWGASGDAFKEFNISKVTADPEVCRLPEIEAAAHAPYLRLHGSPEIYKSSYSDEYLKNLAVKMMQPKSVVENVWCIFDNTAFHHATENANELQNLLKQKLRA